MGVPHPQPPLIVRGRDVSLRDRLPADVERFIHWQTHGEWRDYDAPWEHQADILSREERDQIAQRYLETCTEERPLPRKRAVIVSHDDELIGWVNRYGHERFPDVWYLGIAIGEDSWLNRGVGTTALRLWVDYLFTYSTIHKLALDTWSLNQRMMRVAEKLGFVDEGTERELIQWQGAWHDRIHYGILRGEWEQRRAETEK